jgi:phosphatidylserine synthase
VCECVCVRVSVCVCVYVWLNVCALVASASSFTSHIKWPPGSNFRVGQNRVYTLHVTVYLVTYLPKIPYIRRIYTPHMTVYLVISLPKIPYIHYIYTYIYGSARPTLSILPPSAGPLRFMPARLIIFCKSCNLHQRRC